MSIRDALIPVVFATPRKLPKPTQTPGRVVVLDIAFASEAAGAGFEGITRKYIDALGPRLAMWIDHHDSIYHPCYASDPRFVLHRKVEFGACPPLVTPERVQWAGLVDCLVCHTDFDGLAAAAKWQRGGIEPYVGCDDDAVAIDTCIGKPSAVGQRLDQVLRIDPKNEASRRHVLDLLIAGETDSPIVQAAQCEWQRIQDNTQALATGYVWWSEQVCVLELNQAPVHDKTELLLLGQQKCDIAVVLDEQNVHLAAGFNSGYNFLTLLNLSGGMPTRVSVPRKLWPEVSERLKSVVKN